MKKEQLWQIAGPMMLALSLALAHEGALCFVGAIGLMLSARLHLKGALYALGLLILGGVLSHLFGETHHLWNLALEMSVALSFLITALAFETSSQSVAAMQSQQQMKQLAIGHLEEEIGKIKEEGAHQQILFSKKMEDLQKAIEEVQGEKGALEILNDVLRKNNAWFAGIEEKIKEELVEERKQKGQLAFEFEEMQKDLERLKETDFAIENKKLQIALNQARVEREQTYLINETLMQRQTPEAHEEFERLKKEQDETREQLVWMEGKMEELASIQALYLQLQSQFAEKNQILHDTRKERFLLETELQRLRMEKEEQGMKLDPLSQEWLMELERLDAETSVLAEENRELQAVVTHLINTPAPSFLGETIREAFSQKKKAPSDQPSLEETLRQALAPKKRKRVKKVLNQDLLF